MTTSIPPTLVLGGTGKTGSRVANILRSKGLPVRTAARSGADVEFDWDDPSTHVVALDGVERIYLIGPVMRIDYAGIVSDFLDLAERSGTKHVTYLSAYGMELAPPELVLRAVELDLISRVGLSHSILRPSWFMQDFSETFLKPINGAIVVPTGDGAEAFIDAEDIAAAGAATLIDPDKHNGAQYALTGPESLTVAEAAKIISETAGVEVHHVDLDRDEWIAGAVASGIPADYAGVLRLLTETMASGLGARPNSDFKTATGNEPINFRDFARRSVAAWAEATST